MYFLIVPQELFSYRRCVQTFDTIDLFKGNETLSYYLLRVSYCTLGIDFLFGVTFFLDMSSILTVYKICRIKKQWGLMTVKSFSTALYGSLSVPPSLTSTKILKPVRLYASRDTSNQVFPVVFSSSTIERLYVPNWQAF